MASWPAQKVGARRRASSDSRTSPGVRLGRPGVLAAGAPGAGPTRGQRGPDERRCGSGEPLDRLAVERPSRSARIGASSPSRALHCSSRPRSITGAPSSAAACHRRTALLPSTPLGSRGCRLGIPQTRTRLLRAEGVARATRPHPRRTRITRLSGADDTEAAMKFLFNDESFSFEALRTTPRSPAERNTSVNIIQGVHLSRMRLFGWAGQVGTVTWRRHGAPPGSRRGGRRRAPGRSR